MRCSNGQKDGGTAEMAKVTDIFQCKRCGYCCHGEVTVSLDHEDQRRMVAALQEQEREVQSRDDAAKKYWRISKPLSSSHSPSQPSKKREIVQMKVVDGACIFYCEENGLGGCRVHTARPKRCGEWPLHPSILGDENNFLTIRESCPGINREIDYQSFCAVLKELLEAGQIRC